MLRTTVLILMASVTLAHADVSVDGHRMEWPQGAASWVTSPVIEAGYPVAPNAVTRLSALDTAPLLAEDVLRGKQGEFPRIGIVRDLGQNAAASGEWVTLDDGRDAWRFMIEAPGAYALRGRIEQTAPLAGASIITYSPELPDYAYDLGVGKGYRQGGDFWSHMIEGDRIVFDVILPEGANLVSPPPLVVREIAHIYAPFAESRSTREQWCHNDTPCFPLWEATAASVGRMSFVSGGGVGLCSGQLIATEETDGAPYFLTANHCISQNSVAQSLTVHWFYEARTCDGSVPGLGQVPQTNGAVLINNRSRNDYSLLFVTDALPNGVGYSGWTTSNVANGAQIAGIHHPDGAYKRISFGQRTGSDSELWQVSWTSGVTEGGSSGSGLYNDRQQLVGQLYGGASSCANPQAPDIYGRFNRTYPNVSEWLAGDPFEENDSRPQAIPLNAGDYSNLTVMTYDEDWYLVTLQPQQSATAQVSFSHGIADIDMQVFAETGNTPLQVSESSTNSESVTFANNGSSVARFILNPYVFTNNQTRGEANYYRLELDLQQVTPLPVTATPTPVVATPTLTPTPPQPTATPDGNDSCDRAQSLPLGITGFGALADGDPFDYYSLLLPASGEFRVTMQSQDPSQDYELSVYAECKAGVVNRLLAQSATASPLESLTFMGEGGNRVIIEVRRFRGFGQYSITAIQTSVMGTAPSSTFLAGYVGTDLAADRGGLLTILAIARLEGNDAPEQVGLYANGVSTGIFLPPQDLGTGVFEFATNLGAPLAPGQLALELQANNNGVTGAQQWPYLVVSP